ncbi:MAG: PBECR4 domain-containing protein [Sphaerochaetaceae bacterium]|nr:PBECR4 domain-containing protein [Sphaerochaetaceae bacterium]
MKLKNAALSYNELCNKKYEIIVAKKGKRHNIDLSFNINQFYHLVGVQHLKDINLNYRDKSIFFKDVLNDKINMKKMVQSLFLCDFKLTLTK